jgi:aspartate oxidase
LYFVVVYNIPIVLEEEAKQREQQRQRQEQGQRRRPRPRQRQRQRQQENKKLRSVVTTYAAVLGLDEEKELNRLYPKLHQIFFDQVNSYYNFRTIGPDFEIVTSALSNATEQETVEAFISGRGLFRPGGKPDRDKSAVAEKV